MRTTARLERLPREQLRRYQEERTRGLVSTAFRRAPAMREKMERAGLGPADIRSLDDLPRVPITRKEDLVALQRANPPLGGLCTKSPHELDQVFISPGPVYEPLPPLEGVQLALQAAGIGKGDIVLLALSFHMVPAGMVFYEALRRTGSTVVPTGPGNTELQIEVLRQLGVTAYIGFPRFLVNLIEKAAGFGHQWQRSFALRKACVGGEMFTAATRNLLEQEYRLGVREFYVTADVGMVAYECSEKSGLHVNPMVALEVVDPASGVPVPIGEPGEVVVTAFSDTYPLLRYGTGDAAYLVDEPCPCGRTTPRLGDILGRLGDAPKVRGLFLVPKEVAEVMAAFPELRAYQLEVTMRGVKDYLNLKVEAGTPWEDLARSLKERFRGRCRLDLDSVEFVQPGTIGEGAKVIVDRRQWK